MEKSQQDVQIYETIIEDSESEKDIDTEPSNEAIDTEYASHGAALSAFTEPPTRLNESIQSKVARIRREIEEIRQSSYTTESQDLFEELKAALKPKPVAVPKDGHINEQPQQPLELYRDHSGLKREELDQFVQMEKRISNLERRIGVSMRSELVQRPILSTVQAQEQILSLLSLDSDQLSIKLSEFSSLIKSQTPDDHEFVQRLNWLYNRIKTIDNELRQVPQVLSRLQTLRKLHSEANLATSIITELNATLNSIQTDMASWRSVLTALEKKVDAFIADAK